MNAYAISDIHGCNKTFRALLDRLRLSTDDQLFLLGDYVNKGPDARGVLDTILELRQNGYQVTCLRGNHDDIIVDMPTNESYARQKHIFGAQYTLQSFGVDQASDIPQLYLTFLDSLPTYIMWQEYIFVHAGFSFEKNAPLADTYAHTHIREWYHQVDYQWLGERYIIHGHVQRPQDNIQHDLSVLQRQRILGIDAGCVSVWEPGKGHLCAFDLIRQQCVYQGYIEDSW